jgi:hypothetical protein
MINKTIFATILQVNKYANFQLSMLNKLIQQATVLNLLSNMILVNNTVDK